LNLEGTDFGVCGNGNYSILFVKINIIKNIYLNLVMK